MVGQQIFHSLRKALIAEPLEKCNGISPCILGVAEPGAAVFDAEAVHLLGSVIPSDLPDLIPQMLQQVRQICLPGDLHLRIRKPIVCACLRIVHLLSKKQKTARRDTLFTGCLSGRFSCFYLLFWLWNLLFINFFLEFRFHLRVLFDAVLILLVQSFLNFCLEQCLLGQVQDELPLRYPPGDA